MSKEILMGIGLIFMSLTILVGFIYQLIKRKKTRIIIELFFEEKELNLKRLKAISFNCKEKLNLPLHMPFYPIDIPYPILNYILDHPIDLNIKKDQFEKLIKIKTTLEKAKELQNYLQRKREFLDEKSDLEKALTLHVLEIMEAIKKAEESLKKKIF